MLKFEFIEGDIFTLKSFKRSYLISDYILNKTLYTLFKESERTINTYYSEQPRPH